MNHDPAPTSETWPLEQNPIYVRERLIRSRGRFSRTLQIIYSVFGALLLLTFCGALSLANSTSDGYEVIGYFILLYILFFQITISIFFVPPFTAGAIADERNKQTLDLLLTTTLPTRALIDGKLFAVLPFACRLVFLAAIPLVLTITTAEIHLLQILASQLVLFVTVLLLATFSIFLSAVLSSSLYVLLTVYATAIGWLVFSTIMEIIMLNNAAAEGPFGLSLPLTLVATFVPDTFYNITNPALYIVIHAALAYLFYRLSLWRLDKLVNA